MCRFEDTLHYSSPAHGDRGVVRAGMLAPESYQLFICPFACGRHGAISAVQLGLKDRLSYLYIDQSDIIDGYDNLILDAVDELFTVLSFKPKVLFIFVSCLDDLIGTDLEALMEELSSRYPDVRFRPCHMNPISKDSDCPPPVSIQNNLYSLLEERGERDNGVNVIGSLVAVDGDSEIHTVLRQGECGPVRHISGYDTFEEYQEMAGSRLNLVVSPLGLMAAKQMEQTLGIPYLLLPVTYRAEEIAQNYGKLCGALDIVPPASIPWEQEAMTAVGKALEAVGDLPVLVDGSATLLPFNLARALVEYGFPVFRIVAQECSPLDKKHLDWLLEHAPDIQIVQPQHHNTVKFDNRMEESLSVGVDAAYLSGSRYIVNVFNDEGMYGYHGLFRLMSEIREACRGERNLEAIINGHGLVV